MDYTLPVLEHAYIIVDPETNLYSRAGGVWSKKPKIWTTEGHLKLHFDMFITKLYKSTEYTITNNCPYKGHEEIWDIVGDKRLVADVKTFLQYYTQEKKSRDLKKELKQKKLALEKAEYEAYKAEQKYTESFNV